MAKESSDYGSRQLPPPCDFSFDDILRRSQDLEEVLFRNPSLGFCYIRHTTGDTPELLTQQNRIFQLLQEFCKPIIVYKRHGLWKAIGVDFNVEAERVGGTGQIPLHIDCVNSTLPPDIVGFYCARLDAHGGGETLVSNFYDALSELSDTELSSLVECKIEEGRFFDLSNIGTEYNPFPLLEWDNKGIRWVRYTGKFREQLKTKAPLAFRKFEDLLKKKSYRFLIKNGDILLINQHYASHGRLPLGPHQQIIHEKKHRLLYQIFGRVNNLRSNACRIPLEPSVKNGV